MGIPHVEAVVIALIGTIMALFGVQMFLSRPEYLPVLGALFVPSAAILTNPAMLYIAMGMLGATVMPHNLYLHSAMVQTRSYERTPKGKREAIRFANHRLGAGADAGAVCECGHPDCGGGSVSSQRALRGAAIEDAFKLLSPLVGAGFASTLFAVALLASGQNSSITGTLAGQVVMEGFIHMKLKPWARRMVTRTLAIIPTIIVVALYGSHGTEKLLILSQVILSFQLSFAVVPLVKFTCDRKRMGEFTNGPLLKFTSWFVAALIAGLNVWLLVQTFTGS